MNLTNIIFIGVFAINNICGNSIEIINKYIETKYNYNNKYNISFLENNYQGIKRPIINNLKINKIRLKKVNPNFEPEIIVKEFYNHGNFRESKIKEKLYPNIKSKGYWQDTNYYINEKLILTKRKTQFLSKEHEKLEGILDKNNSTIINSSGEKFILKNNNGIFLYKKE